VEVDWDNVIEYESYPRKLGFYSNKYNKMYFNPIILKYPVYHEYLLEHEKRKRVYGRFNFPFE